MTTRQPRRPWLARTEGHEVVVARRDLDHCTFGKRTMFDFAAHGRPEHYRRIVEQLGAMFLRRRHLPRSLAAAGDGE